MSDRQFSSTSITITAKPTVNLMGKQVGNGFADIGYLQARDTGTNLGVDLASITILGELVGTPDAIGNFDQYGFVAQQIGSFHAGLYAAPLTAGTDAPIHLSPATGDVTIHEIMSSSPLEIACGRHERRRRSSLSRTHGKLPIATTLRGAPRCTSPVRRP